MKFKLKTIMLSILAVCLLMGLTIAGNTEIRNSLRTFSGNVTVTENLEVENINITGDESVISQIPGIPMDGLISAYQLEDNINDASGLGYDLSHSGIAVYDTGKIGKAIDFNDTTSVAFATSDYDIEVLNINKSGSVSFWMKSYEWTTGASPQQMLALHGNGYYYEAEAIGIWIQNNYNDVRILYRNGSEEITINLLDDTNKTNIWMHIGLSWERDPNEETNISLKGYVDGALTISLSSIFDTDETVKLYIGRRKSDYAYNGLIDEVYIFNETLEASELNLLYLQSSHYNKPRAYVSNYAPGQLMRTPNGTITFCGPADNLTWICG